MSSNNTQENKTNTTNIAESAQTISRELIRKFTSRKFLMAVAGLIVGTGGIIGMRSELGAVILFGAVDVISIVGYIITEGRVDAASVKAIVDVVDDTVHKAESIEDHGDINSGNITD